MIMYIDDPCECVPLKSKVLTLALPKMLEERTKRNNPNLGGILTSED